MNKLGIEFLDWEVQLLLLALQELEDKWTTINHTSADEDEVADVGNDLIQLGMVKDRLLAAAQDTFGNRFRGCSTPSVRAC